MKLNQKGFVQLLLVLIMMIGLVVGIYLVQKQQIFKSKAALDQTRIEFLSRQNQVIDQTDTESIKIRLIYVPKQVNNQNTPSTPQPTVSSKTRSASPQTTAEPVSATQLICAPENGKTVCKKVNADVQGISVLALENSDYPTHFRIANDAQSFLVSAKVEDFSQNKIIDWQLSKIGSGSTSKKVLVQFGRKNGEEIKWEADIITGEILIGQVTQIKQQKERNNLSGFRQTFGKKIGQNGFKAEYDVNKDGVINVLDLPGVLR